MKILVLGAGVLGSLYAGKLHQSGQDVTILARGDRRTTLQKYGIVLANEQTSEELVVSVKVIEKLEPEDWFDLIIVLVRKNQLGAVLSTLATNCTPNILFMVNNAAGPDELVHAVGRDRVMLGFPGAGGAREGFMVHYNIVSGIIQKTTVGELDGSMSSRLRDVATALRRAGFPTAISRRMDAWLKTHVALVSPIANAVYAADGSNYLLAKEPETLRLMVEAIREGYRVLHALEIPITPVKLRTIEFMPDSLLIWMMQRALGTRWAETVIARHANAARDEMQTLADEFIALARQASLATPAIDRLYTFISPMEEQPA